MPERTETMRDAEPTVRVLPPRRYGRRKVLRGAGLLVPAALGVAMVGPACAPVAVTNPVASAELYVGLAREHAVAVLDGVTDRVIRRISLASLGRYALPGQIGVGPMGAAAVLPLVGSRPNVGLIRPARPVGAAAAGQEEGAIRRCLALLAGRRSSGAAAEGFQAEEVRVADDPPATTRPGTYRSGPSVEGLVSDGRGRAYVLVVEREAAQGGRSGAHTSVAVLDLARGAVLRHLPLDIEPRGRPPGMAPLPGSQADVMALAVEPDGSRLYVSTWERSPLSWSRGRVLGLETASGAVTMEVSLPDGSTITHFAIGAPPPGVRTLSGGSAETVVYGVVAAPVLGDDDMGWTLASYPLLVAFDGDRLDTLAAWPLDELPIGLAVTPEGRRAYLLAGRDWSGAWSRRLISIDLASGATTGRWPLPGGCLALAMGPAGKVYVADTFGDRLWRVDTRTNTLLGSLSLPGAPLALAARPA
jgi:hypothetical protein